MANDERRKTRDKRDEKAKLFASTLNAGMNRIEFEIEPEVETAPAAAAAKPSSPSSSSLFGAPNAWELIINRCASASRRFARVSVT